MMGKLRKLAAIVLALALMMPVGQALAAGQPTKIMGKSMMHFVVDGIEYTPPEGAIGGFFYDNGKYTYVPLRFMAYILKKDVGWDNARKKVTVFDPKSEETLATIEAYLEERKVANSVIGPAAPLTSETIDILIVPNVTYEFNGVNVTPGKETPGLMINNSIYVPLRFVTENLGYRVDWDRTTLKISTEIAEVDRIVKHYREVAETKKDELTDEAFAILDDLGIDQLNVVRGNLTDEERAKLSEVAKEYLPDVERQLDELIGAMAKELQDINQPTLLAEQLRKELEKTLNLARTFLGNEGANP